MMPFLDAISPPHSTCMTMTAVQPGAARRALRGRLRRIYAMAASALDRMATMKHVHREDGDASDVGLGSVVRLKQAVGGVFCSFRGSLQIR